MDRIRVGIVLAVAVVLEELAEHASAFRRQDIRCPIGRGKLLRGLGFGCTRTPDGEGKDHPDRDAQFRHINETTRSALAADQPVISVDAKKRELVGDFKAVGRDTSRLGGR